MVLIFSARVFHNSSVLRSLFSCETSRKINVLSVFFNFKLSVSVETIWKEYLYNYFIFCVRWPWILNLNLFSPRLQRFDSTFLFCSYQKQFQYICRRRDYHIPFRHKLDSSPLQTKWWCTVPISSILCVIFRYGFVREVKNFSAAF